MYVARALEIRASIIFGLGAVLQVLVPLPPPSSESGLERDSLEYNLKAATLFTKVLCIAIIVASRSLKWLLKTSFIIYLG